MSGEGPDIHLCPHCWQAIVPFPEECCARCAEELAQEDADGLWDDDGFSTEPRITIHDRLLH